MPTKPPANKTDQLDPATQALIDKAVQDAIAATKASLVSADSKPDLVKHLRQTWRKSAEHKAAQVRRFLYALGGVVSLQLIGDVSTGKDPLTHFTDVRTAWYFLLPFALVAWKQMRPSLSASEVDSAPGVTIVPSQVGVPTTDVSVDTADVEVQLPEDTPPDVVADVGNAVEGDAAP